MQSIHERDLLFKNFLGSSTCSSSYSAGNMTSMKEQFSSMVQDRWSRKQMEDPSVDHDFARKVTSQALLLSLHNVVTNVQASAWSNYLGRGATSASEVLGRKHSAARLEASNFNMPKIKIYHSSAQGY